MSESDAVERHSQGFEETDVLGEETAPRSPSTDTVRLHQPVGEATELETESVQGLEEAPPAHEALQNGHSEDVVATVSIQMEAAEQDIRALETDLPKLETNGDHAIPDRSDVEAGVAPDGAETPTVVLHPAEAEAAPLPQTKLANNADTKKLLSTSSLYFVRKTMDVVLASREGKKKGPLRDIATKTAELLKVPPENGVDPNAIFEPLRVACESQSVTVTTQALDCLGKLIAISFFDAPPPAIAAPVDVDEENFVPAQRADAPTRPLMDRVIDTICECFQGEGTDEKVQLQIIKALLSAVLDEKEGTMIHQSPLLKAIRQTYNIFLLSRSTPTQSIAQGTLEQMVHAVFGRVKTQVMADTPLASVEDVKNTLEQMSIDRPEQDGAEDEARSPGEELPQEKVTLDSFARRQSFDKIPETNLDTELVLSHEEIMIKDAFLIFRSMCKLSTKSLAIDNGSDLKSHMVRSKLLSLHMISTILNRHIAIFISPQVIIRSSAASEGIQFIQATKQYLCHALSRNAVSHIPQVFEVSCEIFWRMLDSLRVHLKKEIEVFMIEIYLPILEMKTSSYQQKLTFINVLARLCNDPRALVEIYLNYDCDRGAMDNIYERYFTDTSCRKVTLMCSE